MNCSLPGFSIHGISLENALFWSALPFPSPGDLPDPGVKPMFPALIDTFFTTEPLGKPLTFTYIYIISSSIYFWFSFFFIFLDF